MNEIISKLKEAGNTEAFTSKEAFTAAAKELGFDEAAIAAAVELLDGFPIGDDALADIAGGATGHRGPWNPEW